jgi:hypothetical protein
MASRSGQDNRRISFFVKARPKRVPVICGNCFQLTPALHIVMEVPQYLAAGIGVLSFSEILWAGLVPWDRRVQRQILYCPLVGHELAPVQRIAHAPRSAFPRPLLRPLVRLMALP